VAETTLGPWTLDCDLADGARISRLRYGAVDLLTGPPSLFQAPRVDYGRYETRPVYGYDDCFPTVDACEGWDDHGELCWLPWEGSATDCHVRSRRVPLTFKRRLSAGARALTWAFSAVNHGDHPLSVQHVMHPLMPLDQVTGIDLPPGTSHDAAAVSRQLLSLPRGAHAMLFLNGLRTGRFTLTFRAGLRLTACFDPVLFPTLGIWWNNASYPDQDGLRRVECAFEPTPGPDSRLANGSTMTLPPATETSWQVVWEVGQ
jgi:hypothetical protein